MEVYVVYYNDAVGVTGVTLFSTREKAQKWIDRSVQEDGDFSNRDDYDIVLHYVDDEDYD